MFLLWFGLVVLVSLVSIALAFLLYGDADATLTFHAVLGRAPNHALKGKVVWVTGASSGIGEKLAYVLAKCGSRLILSARREDELKKVHENCKKLSPEATKNSHMVLPLNLLNHSSHTSAALTVLQHYGRIDFLVNNAGRSQRAVALDTTLAVDRAVLELNTIGTISLTKAVLPHLIEQGEGCVVVVNSIAGKLGAPGSASYSASKHALTGFFDTLRMELAESGVSVLSVHPGPVVSNFLRNVFSSSLDEQPKSTVDQDESNRITGSRCAFLIAVTMANQLEEVWIAKHPILLFTYISQYAPWFAMRLGKKVGIKRLKAVKAGKVNIDAMYLQE